MENAWKKILLKLHKNLEATAGKGINIELDFSATPKTETGAYFPWIIEDFTLKEAIEMYMAWIDAGVRRWREYKPKLSKVGRKPILFFMCEDTTAANDVYDYLQVSAPDLKGKTLLIHTKLNGDIIKDDLDEARKAARKIDDPDNPYDAIVSVMMLNEGWDVRNVTVAVGLGLTLQKEKSFLNR